jgi:membrane-bound lytic murein transglycosylase B
MRPVCAVVFWWHVPPAAGLRSPVRSWLALGAVLLSLAPGIQAQAPAVDPATGAGARDYSRPAPKAVAADAPRKAGKAGSADATGFAGRSDDGAFIDDMATAHGFDRAALARAFRAARPQPAVIAAMDRPLLAPPKWYEYAPPLLSPARVDGGVAFLAAHRATLQRAERDYGVPPEVVVAILGVESFYGAHTGRHRTFDASAAIA